MTNNNGETHGPSGVGEDLFLTNGVESVDAPGPDQAAIGLHPVHTATRSRAGGGNCLPLGGEIRAGVDPSAAEDGPSDDPFDVIGVPGISGGNDHCAGVLDAGRVNPVDGVGTGQTHVVVSPHSEVPGKRAGIQHDQKGHDSDGPPHPLHEVECRDGVEPLLPSASEPAIDERMVIPRWIKVAASGFGILIVAALAFAIFEPIQVLPRNGLAPGYSLLSQSGTQVNSEAARGTVTLYTFEPTDCGEACAAVNQTMREVRDRVATEVDLGDTDFRLITIALDPVETNQPLVDAAEASGADGQVWQWVGGDEAEIRTIVGSGFERFYESEPDGSINFDPGFALVDGLGVIRGEYRYQTLASDSDKIVSHVGVLAEEIRYAGGAAAVAYEAAHLFLCYP